jgi:methionyl aminopeptidase
MGIIVKTLQEIAIMREAGRIVAAVLATLTRAIAPGMTTRELDAIAVRELKRYGAAASFKGYGGFPASVCVSINDELVHGIPGERLLQEGDIVSLDFGAYYRGFHGDAAVTVGVGNISLESRSLIEVTEGALRAGIAAARQGARLGDISAAIQSHVESRGFSVVREYVGHGVGRELHEEPQVPNFGTPGQGPLLQNGMTLALEPMVNAGDWRTKVNADKWTVVTADGSLSAHFENTIAIDGAEPKILTQL